MIWRYRISLFLIVCAFLLVIARLFYWQVVKAEELSGLGRAQYGKSIEILPIRGEIKASDGFPLATNKISYQVFANPKEIKNNDKEKIINILPSILEVDTASLSAKLNQDLFWVSLKKEVDNDLKEKVKSLNLSGIGIAQGFSRFYPEASMSAQLIGFVGKNEDGQDKGYFGLEGYYDRQLRGKAGITLQVNDAIGRPIISKLDQNSQQIDGRSLILNIDRSIQFLAERRLKEGIEEYQASGGMVIVMEPKTGNILALASFPSFDPRNYQSFDDKLFRNPIISNLFEPGSTFKSLIMASALDAKVVKPETKCPICSKPVKIGEYEIKTWNNEYFKDINMVDTIIHSDNTGMVYTGQQLGIDRTLSYLKDFGIGELTGIDLQGEVYSELKPRGSWYPIDFATLTFGQGITVTPIMLIDAFSAIANKGNRMEPHIVSKIETSDGQDIPILPKVLSHPISEATAKVMTEILVQAVNKGEAQWVKVKGYRVAGKTGTAQIPIAGHYDPNKTIASFIGFAPASDPKFSMLVIIDRPTTSIYGAETAAPIFFDIAKDLFAYYKIPPTEN